MLYVPSGAKGHRELAAKVVREQERLTWRERVRGAWAVFMGRASALRVDKVHR